MPTSEETDLMARLKASLEPAREKREREETEATNERSEPMERVAALLGSLSFTLDVVVAPSQVPALVDEGRQAWGKQYGVADPGGWSDEDYAQYALKARMRLPLEATHA